MSDLAQLPSPRTFIVGGNVSFMSIVVVAMLQLTLIAIIFLIFYYYWFVQAVTKVQHGFGGGRSLRRSTRSIFGVGGRDNSSPVWGILRRNKGENTNGSFDQMDEVGDLELTARITSAIERGAKLQD